MRAPAVSVVMPARDAGTTVRRALESLLTQTLADIEVVVIDDGSTDDTLDIVRQSADERVRVLTHSRSLGLVRSLHDGIAAASSDCIARMDADDVSCPTRLERQLERLRADPRIGLVATGWEARSADGRSLGVRKVPVGHAEARFRLAFANCLAHPSIMYLRPAVDACGGYLPEEFPAEDYGLWVRMLRNCGFAGVDSVELFHYEHPEAVSARSATEQQAATLAIAARATEDLVGRAAPAVVREVLAGYEADVPAELVTVAADLVVDVFDAVRRPGDRDGRADVDLEDALAVLLSRAGIRTGTPRATLVCFALAHPAIAGRLTRRALSRRAGSRRGVVGRG